MNLSSTLRSWRGVTGEGRAARGDFSQAEAAAHIGVPLKTYIDWEQARFAPDPLKAEAVLARIFTRPSRAKKSAARPRAGRVTKPAKGTRAVTRGGKKRVTHAKK